MRYWYAVQTQSSAEARAIGNLMRQGFETFFPRYHKTRRHARKVETIEAPLFPGYVFVRLDLGVDRWRAIHSTLGVRRLVCLGEDPAPVPSAVMAEIQVRSDEAGLVEPPLSCDLRRGSLVEIVSGPFAECSGIFEELDDQRRAVLLLSLLGRPVRLSIGVEAIRA